ncbi:hypothetical protein [Elizabethkingia anophelis]|uniref:hypothetical protein n=1 Tax=Elizabethkingia anophelis TaxID=1117645 RepID=UPI00083FFD44|nr:hypothetical protein [Elizabethkingia anophelis]MCT3638893.1 hypothetical protein [Elizabethkingia anophelis]MCT3742977.1 hypothetical protein [Elizabethkingia anophelis]MCT3750207.1 hypothetical protein [Elizabethkingia anophelis]MCT3753645.1 hypothetical protein [Elizabethkingia anophelis]MCT3871467.1 hypothetical protein [Elizabethkingia anophelis]
MSSIVEASDVIDQMKKSKDGVLKFIDSVINFNESTDDILDVSKTSLFFKNCRLIGSRLNIYGLNKSEDCDPSLIFENCIIDSDLYIGGKIKWLIFDDNQINSRNFFISNSNIGILTITNKISSTKTINNLLIKGSKITSFLDLRLINFTDILNLESNEINELRVNKNIFNRLHIQDCKFGESFEFIANKISYSTLIKGSTFGRFNCLNTNFGDEIYIKDCEFNGSCIFEKIGVGNITSFRIKESSFNKQVYYDSSDLYSIQIESSFFRDIVSFQNTTCNSIKFNRTHFEKIAFFSNIKIIAKHRMDMNTIRIIKAQLLKAENKIDYLEFKKHEFELYRKSLNKNKNGSRAILWLNKFTSNYNTNWIQGIVVTLMYGFIFYVILYLVVFGLGEMANVLTENRFWLGYFKYMIIPNFTSPFGEIELSRWNQYLFFILGKISVTYGLYETIQSFRKYGKT